MVGSVRAGWRLNPPAAYAWQTWTALKRPLPAPLAAGPTCYASFATSFDASSDSAASLCTAFPGTAIGEIAGYGVNVNALVLGKPLLPSDTAFGGFVNATVLGGWQEPVRGAAACGGCAPP